MVDYNLEMKQLLEKVKKTDFSYKNPLVQNLVEKRLEKWIASWEEKKEGKRGRDFYGTLEDMPEKIIFQGNTYTPQGILQNVKERTEIGIEIIKTIKKYQNEYPVYYEKEFSGILKETIEEIGKGDLENVVMSCMCGQHKKTGRELINDIINIDEDSMFLNSGLSDSIKRLYDPNLDPIWDLGKN